MLWFEDECSKTNKANIGIPHSAPTDIEEMERKADLMGDNSTNSGSVSAVLPAVSEYVRSLLAGLYADCLVHGNIGTRRTTQLAEKVKEIISKYALGLEGENKECNEKEQSKQDIDDIKTNLGDRYNPPQQVVLLSPDRVVIVCAIPRNPNEKNECIEAYYQQGK